MNVTDSTASVVVTATHKNLLDFNNYKLTSHHQAHHRPTKS